MDQVEKYLEIIKEEKIILYEEKTVSSIIGKIRDFLKSHAPRNSKEMDKIKKDYNHKIDACHKYLITSHHEPKLSAKYPYSVETSTTMKSNVHSGIYNCKMTATVKYYQDIISLLKKSVTEACADNSDKQKCKKWVENKINEYGKELKYAMFSKQFINGKK